MFNEITNYLKQINRIVTGSIILSMMILFSIIALSLLKHAYITLLPFLTVVAISNCLIAISSYPRDKILPYLFILATIVIEIFSLILIIFY